MRVRAWDQCVAACGRGTQSAPGERGGSLCVAAVQAWLARLHWLPTAASPSPRPFPPPINPHFHRHRLSAHARAALPCCCCPAWPQCCRPTA